MYSIEKDSKMIAHLIECDFSSIGVKERQDIEEWAEKEPNILGENLLIVQKEFAGFDDTKERLDLLSIDENGYLVIIELKRDDSGRNVNWQAIKYAAYCSTLTNDDIFEMYSQYLSRKNSSQISKNDAANYISNFLDVDVDALELNSKQRIILVSKKYRKEVLATAMWLLDNNIDVKCVGIQPYKDKKGNFFIVPTVILPPPNTEEYRIKKNKVRIEHEKRIVSRGNHCQFFADLKEAFNEKMEENVLFSKPGKEYYKIKTAFPVDQVHFEFLYPDDSSFIITALHLEPNNDENKKLLKAIMEKAPDWQKISGIKLDENWKYGIQFSIEFDCTNKEENEIIEWAVGKMKILYTTFNPVLEAIKKEENR